MLIQLLVVTYSGPGYTQSSSTSMTHLVSICDTSESSKVTPILPGTRGPVTLSSPDLSVDTQFCPQQLFWFHLTLL